MSSNSASRLQSSPTKLPPLIVDLGKVGRKKIKELKSGTGIYLEEVEPALFQVKEKLGKEAEGKEILPVVVIYERKPSRRTLFDLLS